MDERQKSLTAARIKQDIRAKRNGVWPYVRQLLLVALTLGIMSLGAVAAGLFFIGIAVNVLRLIVHDVKHTKPGFYVLERACIEKQLKEFDEAQDEWWLWFLNADNTLNVAIPVEKSFYDETQLGEEFYVVFLEKEKCPSLVYRKSQWLLNKEGLSPVTPT